MYDFGVGKILARLLLIVVAGAVILGALALLGCGSVNGALAQKNVSETSRSDDSISFQGSELVSTIDPVAVIEAKTGARVEEIRAREEKWRLLVWVFGAGAVLISALALFIRSPLDRGRK